MLSDGHMGVHRNVIAGCRPLPSRNGNSDIHGILAANTEARKSGR